MARRRAYLVAYDIADPKRLARVRRYLSKCAAPVQYSVFVATWDLAEWSEHWRRLEDLIDAREDDVRAYPMPAARHVMTWGRSRTAEGIGLLGDGMEGFYFRSEDKCLG